MSSSVLSDHFESMGMSIMNRNPRRGQANMTMLRRFVAWYGIAPSLCAFIWLELVASGWTSFAGRNPCSEHLLWALLFLRCYNTEEIHAAQVCADEKTFRKWVWFYLEGIANLETKFILWTNRFRGDTYQRCLVTIDGTDFTILEPTPFSTRWFSHKFCGPGLRYELGVAINTGDIVSYNGPYPCGEFPDLKIFRLGLRGKLGVGEKVIADNGYRGDTKVCLPNSYKNRQHRTAMNRARARHESINRRLKTWKCLKRVFRHHREKHNLVFRSVLVIEQIAIENGRAPFQITNYNDPVIAQYT